MCARGKEVGVMCKGVTGVGLMCAREKWGWG